MHTLLCNGPWARGCDGPGFESARKGKVRLDYLQEVVVFWDPQDAESREAIGFLRAHGIGCDVRDVRADPGLWQDLRYIGARRIPTIVVNGVAIEGFCPETLREVLGV